MNAADFHLPPGSPGDGKQDFYAQAGLNKWIADRFWTEESAFYQDPTPRPMTRPRGWSSTWEPPIREGSGSSVVRGELEP